MIAGKAQPKVEIGVRVFKAKEKQWVDHGKVKIQSKMARLFAGLVKRRKGEVK